MKIVLYRMFAGTCTSALAIALIGGPASAAPPAAEVQLLAVNDFHGNLDPVPGAAGSVITVDASGRETAVPAGGIARMATLLEQHRAGRKRTLTVGGGDMIGGSPLISAAYHDEPTVDALETLGLDVSAVGNHEFDEGRAELLRVADGGCHPVDGCATPDDPYDGADFPDLAANVVDTATGKPILPPYWIKKYGQFKVGFIGLATKDVPSVVVQAGIAGLEFRDEVATIDKYARELTRNGVNAVVTLIHEGGPTRARPYDFDCDAEGPGSGLSGRIKQIAQRASAAVDLIVSAHSHDAYVCTIPDPAGRRRLVTQAASFGRTFTDIRFTVDRTTRDIDRASVQAANHIVTLDTPEDPGVRTVVEAWRARSAQKANQPVGYIAGDLLGRGATTPETPLGDVIADSQAEATAAAGGSSPSSTPAACEPTSSTRRPSAKATAWSPTAKRSRSSRSTTSWSPWT